MMRVTFKDVKAGTGADIWVSGLSGELKRQGISSSVRHYPLYYNYIPYLLKIIDTETEEGGITHSNIVYGFAFKKNDPLVVTEHHLVHDPSYRQYSSPLQKAYYRYMFHNEKKTLKVADIVTCDSMYTSSMLEKQFEYSDPKMIYAGVDPEIFKPVKADRERYGLDEKTKVLFFAGNPSKRKGADLLPSIMKKLGKGYVLLMTSGLRNDRGVNAENIITIGRVSETELVSLYNLCDVFLFPTRLEGFGFTVAEAMSCGKPVVSTDCSSIPELVENGKGGFLCKRDDIEDIAEKVSVIAKDENLARSMGAFNRRRVLEKFTLERMAKEYIRLYGSLV